MTAGEDEVIRTPLDKHRGHMPLHRKSRQGGVAFRPPALWSSRPTIDAEPIAGQYPKGFVEWAVGLLRTTRAAVLHVCSGALREPGLSVDIRRAAGPRVVADGCALPFRDGSVEAVMIDPPYSVEYARDLYGVRYPRPSRLLLEAARVVRPGGRVGFFHFMVPSPPRGLGMEGVFGVTTGCGYRIRAFTVFVRDQASLFAEGGAA